jgi:hypothetical protein
MSKQGTVVIYHENCNDGFGAAYALWTKLKEKARYLAMGYRSAYNVKQFEDKDILIVDFSFNPDVLLKEIAPIAKSVTILDHHHSSKVEWDRNVPEMQQLSDSVSLYQHNNVKVLFDMNKSGAMMAWEDAYPEIAVPTMIRHIQDADLYQFKDPDSRAFDLYLRSLPRDFELWENEDRDLRNENFEAYALGGAIQTYYNNQVRLLTNSKKVQPIQFEIEVDGGISIEKGYCLNASLLFANECGEALAKKNSTFGLIWETDGTTCFCSIRAVDRYDCIPIAKKFGGGGHKRSCGFTMPLSMMHKYLN